MPRSVRRPGRPGRVLQRGYVLVTALLFLVVLTLLGIGLFRSTAITDRISANTRDKERSFEAAQAALAYGEWWLTGASAIEGDTCTGIVSGNTAANVHVCSNALGTPTDAPWANGFSYTPPNLTVAAQGGVVSASNPDVNYQAPPTFYVERLGLSADGNSQLFQLTAAGFGGNADTRSVVRSTYALTSAGRAADGL